MTFDHSTYKCGNYSREETIQGRKLYEEIRYVSSKDEDFDQTYVNTGLKTQNMEELSLDLIFHDNFW